MNRSDIIETLFVTATELANPLYGFGTDDAIASPAELVDAIVDMAKETLPMEEATEIEVALDGKADIFQAVAWGAFQLALMQHAGR